MTRRSIVNSVVALVAILITGALAAISVISGPPSQSSTPTTLESDGQAALRAGFAAVEGSPAVALATEPTVTTPVTVTAPSATPRPRRPPPDVSPTTDPPPPPPVDPGPVAVTPVGSPSPTPTGSTVGPPATTTAWSLVENGVSVTARIEPTNPRIGDAVTIHYTTHGGGDFCCWTIVQSGGEIIGENRMPQGPCPLAPLTSGSTTVVVTERSYQFQIHATKLENLCQGPTPIVFSGANLYAAFEVQPAE